MISINNISKSFGNKTIINNLSLTIYEGEITFIVGSSGAGKSTLLNLIGGLDTVSSGEISYNGKNISDNLNEYRAEHVGFVFQEYNLITGMSVKDNIKLGLYYCDKEESIAEIDEQLKNLCVKDVNQTVETLSGGEKQRAAIVRTVCKNSNIILADEPSGNLDSENAENVFELLSGLKNNRHIIIVTHDMEKANKYGDRIITIKDGRIEEDYRSSEKTDFEKEVKSRGKKGRQNWKSVVMLGWNSIKLRKSRILSIALVIALAISSIAMAIHFSQSGNRVSQNVNVNYLESDLIQLFYPQTMNLGYKETPFEEKEVAHIQNTYDLKRIVPIYTEGNGSWFFNHESVIKDAVIKQIIVDDFFEERVMSNEIEGDFIAEEDEIILAEDIAEALFDGNCIGNKISLNDGAGNSIQFKIVGINHTVNAADEIYSFVSSNQIKKLLEKQIDAKIESNISLEKYYTEMVDMKTGFIYGALKETQGTEKILYGKEPEQAEELVVSSELIQYVFEGLGIENNYSKDDILNGAVSKDIITEIESQKLTINCNGLFEVHICGVYQSDEIELRCSKHLLNDLRSLEPTVLEVYAANTGSVTDIIKDIEKNEEYTAASQLESLKNNVGMQTRFFEISIILLGTIMVIISISMLASFSKISVMERKKEIGIIKSLGASDRNVFLTLWFDIAVISVAAMALALWITKIFMIILPDIMGDIAFIEYTYPIKYLLLIGVLFMAVITVYTMVGMKKLVKKMPALLLK
ncbi:MAG: ATP-binding cassette domain-containing protein [Lachnospiraceae bacterium]|nr:ATP-binding cassette domain-containing protein [Lachnospiraceae bacterium]